MRIITTGLLLTMLLATSCADSLDDKPKDGWSVDEQLTSDPDDGNHTDPDPGNDRPKLDPEPDPVEPDPDPIEPDPVDPDPVFPYITSAFVSGHLGNYYDCPEEGFSGTAADAGGADELGACAEGQDCRLNCEGAQLTIQISNDSDLELSNIRITGLELLKSNFDFAADLPILTVVDPDGSEEAPTLQPGETILLRVEFVGPADPYELLSSADATAATGGVIDITIEADHVESDILRTPLLYTLAAIAT